MILLENRALAFQVGTMAFRIGTIPLETGMMALQIEKLLFSTEIVRVCGRFLVSRVEKG
jgi:hypothetical protein